MPQTILDNLQRYNQLIRESSTKQADLVKEVVPLLKEITLLYKSLMPNTPTGLDSKIYNQHKERLLELKNEINEVTKGFNKYMNTANQIHGEYSHIWGSYAEKTLFEATTALLQKHHQCDTFYYKTKKVYDKNKHLEIDMLAESATEIYVVEIKAILKEEVFKQFITIIEKFNTHFPQGEGTQIVPVLACLSATDNLIAIAKNAGILVVTQFEDEFTFI